MTFEKFSWLTLVVGFLGGCAWGIPAGLAIREIIYGEQLEHAYRHYGWPRPSKTD